MVASKREYQLSLKCFTGRGMDDQYYILIRLLLIPLDNPFSGKKRRVQKREGSRTKLKKGHTEKIRKRPFRRRRPCREVEGKTNDKGGGDNVQDRKGDRKTRKREKNKGKSLIQNTTLYSVLCTRRRKLGHEERTSLFLSLEKDRKEKKRKGHEIRRKAVGKGCDRDGLGALG